ncbi:response regulator receiver domain protein [Nostoc carneum NIES-2107]|nr:response regulator receiver domain protein [Nostoc carneum NIES-2107]
MHLTKSRKNLVLIADYEASYQALFNFILEKKQWEINQAQNATEAIQISCKRQPNLLFLDERMPQLLKRDIYSYLRTYGIKLPVISLTDYEALTKLVSFNISILLINNLKTYIPGKSLNLVNNVVQ